MPIYATWANHQNNTILIEFSGNWSWDRFDSVRYQIIEMLKSVDHTVDFIADFTRVDRIPKGGLSLGRNLMRERLPNEGVSIVVGELITLRMLYKGFITVFPSIEEDFRFVRSFHEVDIELQKIQQNRNVMVDALQD